MTIDTAPQVELGLAVPGVGGAGLLTTQDLNDLASSKDLKSFEQSLARCAWQLEFDTFAATAAHAASTGRVVAASCTNRPSAFELHASSKEECARDPVLLRLKETSIPFCWSQADYVDGNAADLWDIQAPFGFRNGIAVALHLPMNRHFFVGFNRDKTLVQTDGSFVRLLANVQLVAAYAHAAALRICLPRCAEHNNFQLSNRELEVLRWASEGKTAWETGQILSIAEATATNHLKSAVRQLDCVNKTQAVAKAISIGLL